MWLSRMTTSRIFQQLTTRRNKKASKSNLVVAAGLATTLLMSIVTVLGPIESHPALAGTFPGFNGV